ncbi:MAG: hypothetical protein M3R47_07460 [Chloroflexota bacterium]|nr:hypothetical protein [Chloroflexota bacterium]
MKKFYTEKDIEELFKSGARSLRVDDTIALTDLAYEKAKQLGLQLLFDNVDIPSPLSAPIRPYLSDALIKAAAPVSTPSATQQIRTTPKVDVAPSVVQSVITPPLSQTEKGSAIAQRIRSAVFARLGNQVDAKLLDVIIQRVLQSTGMK